jgi:hypothetical protein
MEIMDSIELKAYLHDLIDKTNDMTLLSVIKTILNKQHVESDFWNEIPESIKESVKIALEEAERGETISHDKVIKEARIKYGL